MFNIARLPELDTAELTNLLANAKRLATRGTAVQQTDAAALLPEIEAEMARRKEATRTTVAARIRAAAPGAKPKAPAKAKTGAAKKPSKKAAKAATA